MENQWEHEGIITGVFLVYYYSNVALENLIG
jgi:hypothetical protein